MSNQRLYNKRKFKRTLRRVISPEMFLNEVGLIVNYPGAICTKENRQQGYWAFSYLLCNTHWHASGTSIKDFSSLYTSSGRSIGFICEFVDHTHRTARRCARNIRNVNKSELMN